MLFHVTATHTPENCAVYDDEVMARLLDYHEGLAELAERFSVRVHSYTFDGPGHRFFWLLEAENIGAISSLLLQNPMHQTFTTTPVMDDQDLMAMGKKWKAMRAENLAANPPIDL